MNAKPAKTIRSKQLKSVSKVGGATAKKPIIPISKAMVGTKKIASILKSTQKSQPAKKVLKRASNKKSPATSTIQPDLTIARLLYPELIPIQKATKKKTDIASRWLVAAQSAIAKPATGEKAVAIAKKVGVITRKGNQSASYKRGTIRL